MPDKIIHSGRVVHMLDAARNSQNPDAHPMERGVVRHEPQGAGARNILRSEEGFGCLCPLAMGGDQTGNCGRVVEAFDVRHVGNSHMIVVRLRRITMDCVDGRVAD